MMYIRVLIEIDWLLLLHGKKLFSLRARKFFFMEIECFSQLGRINNSEDCVVFVEKKFILDSFFTEESDFLQFFFCIQILFKLG